MLLITKDGKIPVNKEKKYYYFSVVGSVCASWERIFFSPRYILSSYFFSFRRAKQPNGFFFFNYYLDIGFELLSNTG